MKQRIIRYLGQLGRSINFHLLSTADEEMSRKAIAWDTTQHLKFDMPFVDMKPTIYLGKFLFVCETSEVQIRRGLQLFSLQYLSYYPNKPYNVGTIMKQLF